jgi:hypothetical protein
MRLYAPDHVASMYDMINFRSIYVSRQFYLVSSILLFEY